MVCYMYYTDVFLGSVNIDKLKSALNAELGSFNSNDLKELVQGLCLFLGYPSCVCSLKLNVDKSLQDISGKLIQDSKAVKSSHSITTLTLNCNSCNSKKILCKCCVISCIKELRGKSKQCKCPRLNDPSKECKCKGTKEKCCKDFLSGLEACLSLLNLQTDLKDCKCVGPDCCESGTCTNGSCKLCKPQNFSDNAMTGLGICPMNPRKLAGKLEGFFGSGQGPRNGCTCKCGSGKSCCCLACDSNMCLKSCTAKCGSSGQCSCASNFSQCPCKDFCSKINGLKVLAKAGDMRCCESGKNCHCQLDPSNKCTPGSSGKCCVVDDKSGSGSNFQQGVKCMIRRLVRFFNGLPLDLSSKKDCSKLCCEIFCVLKCCEFLKMFYDRGGKESCSKCKSPGKCLGSTLKTQPSSNNCCNGTAGCQSGNCCQGCQDCDALKFRKALEDLKYSSPCGQDLWRVLDNFLYYCFSVFMGHKDFIRNTVLAAVKDCSNCNKTGQRSSDWKACKCSSGLSCKACDTLLKDSKLMSILRQGYVSSYVNSTWDSLCPKSSSSKCCCGRLSCSCSKSSSSSLCCQSQSSCDPKNCCEACPQRKAAKIFLGMLPCLYFGLKILYDRSKYGSGFAGWHDISVSNGNPSSDLAKFFFAWGYDLDPLKTKKGSEFPPMLENLFGGSFKSLFETSKKYFTSLSSPGSHSQPSPKPPQTVREILLWLYGLRFTSGFSSLVSHCSSLCSPFGNSFHPDAFCYYIHTSCFLAPIAIISAIETSDYTVANFFSDAQSEVSEFHYPEDPFALLEKLCDYIRKIYIPLHFLRFQCERIPGHGGWQDCAYGQSCAEKFKGNSLSSGSSPVTSALPGSYCCPPGSGQGILCNKDHSGKCSAASHSSSQCPHHLMRFLIDGSKDSQNSKSLFKPPEGFPPMGFSNLSPTGRSGESLHGVLIWFCREGFYPLTRLLQFSLCIFRNPPETLGELFSFFQKFAEALNSKSDLSSRFVQWIDGEPGRYPGKALQDAVRALYGSEDSHKNSSHPFDLYSLIACPATKESRATCGKYLHPLTYNAYNNNIFIEGFLDTYLSFICYLAKDFKKKLEEFHHDASTKFKSCCSTGSCEKIVTCPCALPFFYSFGFGFWSPKGLNCPEHDKHTPQGQAKDCTLKSCSQFLTQLDNVVKGDPFKALLRIIDEFIW
ncbi:variant erythrocyte surface antigen-1 family protein, partial [Babesia divergens]